MSDHPHLERGRLEDIRRERRDQLLAMGVAPYAYAFDRTHSAREALAAATGKDYHLVTDTIRVAGRVVAWRDTGKTVFAHLEDDSGRIQVYFRRDDLGDQWPLVQLLDLDDHIGVSGKAFRTRTEEPTVFVQQVTLLSKSLRPLPRGKTERLEDGSTITHGGLSDPEVRYRQRYADFAVHPELRQTFVLRAAVISWIRRFLDGHGFLEVETPILQPLYGGAMARPFMTHHNTLDMPLFLRIADELYLKRLIVGGFERVYEIGHNFRNEGMDRSHLPEFTMLEWYEAYADYHGVKARFSELVEGLVRDLMGTHLLERGGHTLDFTPPFARVIAPEAQESSTTIRTSAGSDSTARRKST